MFVSSHFFLLFSYIQITFFTPIDRQHFLAHKELFKTF